MSNVNTPRKVKFFQIKRNLGRGEIYFSAVGVNTYKDYESIKTETYQQIGEEITTFQEALEAGLFSLVIFNERRVESNPAEGPFTLPVGPNGYFSLRDFDGTYKFRLISDFNRGFGITRNRLLSFEERSNILSSWKNGQKFWVKRLNDTIKTTQLFSDANPLDPENAPEDFSSGDDFYLIEIPERREGGGGEEGGGEEPPFGSPRR
jgi:hypothetical protein